MEEDLVRKMKYKWNYHHKKIGLRPGYPNEEVVKFIFTQFPKDFSERHRLKMLDLGCGAGANTVFLSKEGFRVYATDISEVGLRVTRQRLKDNKLNATVEYAHMENQPFLDNFFDGIVVYGVLQYNNREGYRRTVKEICRILKKKGKALIYTRSSDDYTFGKGKKIERKTFRLNSANEKGMLVHYLDRQDINKIFGGFRDLSLKKIETKHYNLKKKDSLWVIYLKK